MYVTQSTSTLRFSLLALASLMASNYGVGFASWEARARLVNSQRGLRLTGPQRIRPKGSFKQKARNSARIAARRSHRALQRALRSRR